jgi:ABC-type transport system involved in cytochrome bd biosynthesis fused ATPase/permease subunit
VVLEKGRVVDAGTHDELMARGGTYRELYELQFSDELKEQSESIGLKARTE